MLADPTTNLRKIALQLRPPAAWIALSKPPVNVIDIPMMDELQATLEELEERSDITCVVFSDSGKDVAAGVDVAAHTPDKVGFEVFRAGKDDQRVRTKVCGDLDALFSGFAAAGLLIKR